MQIDICTIYSEPVGWSKRSGQHQAESGETCVEIQQLQPIAGCPKLEALEGYKVYLMVFQHQTWNIPIVENLDSKYIAKESAGSVGALGDAEPGFVAFVATPILVGISCKIT